MNKKIGFVKEIIRLGLVRDTGKLKSYPRESPVFTNCDLVFVEHEL